MGIQMHKSWVDLDWRSFQHIEKFCPLCDKTHTLFLDAGVFYCPLNSVELSGWDINLYQKISGDPRDVDLSVEYQEVKDRVVRKMLLKTLPIMIDHFHRRDAERDRRFMESLEPRVIERVVQKKPEFDRTYWNRVANMFE